MSTPQDTFNKLKWGSQVPKLKDKIEQEMDILQDMFEDNIHIRYPNKAMEQIAKCRLYSAHMNDEDSDYLAGCTWAVENQHEWHICEEDKRINRGPNWKPKDYEFKPVDNEAWKKEVRYSSDMKFRLIWSDEENKWVADPVQLQEYLDKKKNINTRK